MSPLSQARVFSFLISPSPPSLFLYCSIMLSMAIRAPNFPTFSPPSTSKPIYLPPKPFLSFNAGFKPPRFVCRPYAAPEALEIEEEDQLEEKEVRVAVKRMEKPRLVLKFVWMEKNIGLALDQVIPGYGTVPLSPYYFWPRKDAWEELKSLLESKAWISQKRMIILLNQATDIINLWQQSGGAL
ncbi:putative ribosomal protein PSRP-3/Ycf65 [Dioscorea sansibarensis]